MARRRHSVLLCTSDRQSLPGSHGHRPWVSDALKVRRYKKRCSLYPSLARFEVRAFSRVAAENDFQNLRFGLLSECAKPSR